MFSGFLFRWKIVIFFSTHPQSFVDDKFITHEFYATILYLVERWEKQSKIPEEAVTGYAEL